MRLLLTRPTDDSRTFAARLAQHRIETVIAPLMTVDPISAPDTGFSLEGVQAVVLTSANGVRALAGVIGSTAGGQAVPVYAVGDATAREARDAGFQRIESASGDMKGLVRLVAARCTPAGGTIVHVAGTAVAGDLAEALVPLGFNVRRAVLYSARAADRLPAEATDSLTAGHLDGVALFSPRSAVILEDCVARRRLTAALSDLTAFVLSDNVAAALHADHWRHIVVAPEPTADALLEIILSASGGRAQTGRCCDVQTDQTGNR